jgi:hypothetical protein
MFGLIGRAISGSALVLFLLAEPVLAEAPLPPGKPAGVRAAQVSTDGLILVGTALVLLVGGLFAVAQPYRVPGQSSTTSTGH